MKVLSMHQPWASLVVIGAKKIETRSWNTKHRGPLLIHASMKHVPELLSLQCSWNFDAAFHSLGGTMSPGTSNINFKNDLPFGSIIGSVYLEDTRATGTFTVDELDTKQYPPGVTHKYWTERDFGDYSLNRYGWILKDPVQFKEPIQARGSLSLWNFQMCKVCGCWEEDACVHPDHGNCYWAEEDLCTHCKDHPGEATRYSKLMETKRCISPYLSSFTHQHP